MVCFKFNLKTRDFSRSLIYSIWNFTHFRTIARSLMETSSDVGPECTHSHSSHPYFSTYMFTASRFDVLITAVDTSIYNSKQFGST